MNCPACAHKNNATANFCEACGEKLLRHCEACAAELSPDAKFCPQCGVAASGEGPFAAQGERNLADYTPRHLAEKILQSRAALEGERKQVTVLFCDIKGSMALARRIDAEDWHAILERYFEIVTDAVHRYEGTVNQYTGDGVMVLFGAPIAHEDHAQRACYAALQMRANLRHFAEALRIERGLDFSIRVGLNSGDVVVGRIGDDLRMDYTAQGHTVGLAQRIEQLAAADCVYLSQQTQTIVVGYFELRALGRSRIDGESEPVEIFELKDVSDARSRLDVSRSRGLTQFVGRSNEMEILDKALERARDGHGQVVGVVGKPGLGKSRLCYEFVKRCRTEGIAVYECHCPSYGKTIPFIPILELFRSYFGISERDAAITARHKIAGMLVLLDPSLQPSLPTLFDFLGVADPNEPPVTLDAELRQRLLFDMLHKVVRAQSARGVAAVTLIDDLHWIDSWSDAYVAQMVEVTENSRGMLLLNFRPEYRAVWAGKSHYQQLPLVPLGTDAIREMLGSLLGDDDSVKELASKIMEWTAGNPLFSEEVINTLLETGQLEGVRGAYQLSRPVDQLEVPRTVQAIIAARVDRLGENEKAVLQRAAVIGKEFSLPILQDIAELEGDALRSTLEHLKTNDFIFETAL